MGCSLPNWFHNIDTRTMAQLLDPIKGVKNTSIHVESSRCKLTQYLTTGLCKYFESVQQFDSEYRVIASFLHWIYKKNWPDQRSMSSQTGKSSHRISSHRDWTVCLWTSPSDIRSWMSPSDICLWTSPGDICLWTSPSDIRLWMSPSDICLWTSPSDIHLWTSPISGWYLLL
jgi:hypothetical protein